MPVIAQGCKPKPVAVPPALQQSSRAAPGSSNENDDESDRLDPSTLNGAIAAAQQTRALQTANAAAFLAATNGSGKHKYAGKNVSIGETNGYITDKGLFKKWSDGNLMTNAEKYGCPASSAITTLSGYSLPTNSGSSTAGNYNGNYGAYVGAKIDSSTDDPLFMGSDFAASWDNSESSLPACGNEGSNVQVVYPAKATRMSYRGTYNANKTASDTYMTKHDMGAVTHDSCKQRAEDVGHSVFGLSLDKCYTAPTLNESIGGGIAYEVKSKLLKGGSGTAVQLHFSMNGKISLLTTRYMNNYDIASSDSNPYSISELGRSGFSQASNQVVTKCMYGNGGLLATQPTGTWGENCNSVRTPYLKSVYIGTW